jgi:hypothetical protein
MFIRVKQIGAAACLGTLAACGGGSSSPPPPSVTSFPAAAALNAFAQANHTFNLSAMVSGVTVTAHLTYTVGASGSFGSPPQTTSTATISVLLTNTSSGATSSASDVSYFDVNPFQFVGDIVTASSSGSNVGYETVYANQHALPAMASVGQSGALDTSTTYSDHTHMTPVSTQVETWSVSQATSTTGWLCDNSTSTPAGGGAAATESECYQVDGSGKVSGLTLTIPFNGQNVTFQ